MASIRISPGDRSWLEGSGLVDDVVDLGRVKLHVGFPWSQYLRVVGNSAITFGDHVWYRDQVRRVDRDLLVHELVHVGQYRQRGFVRFLLRYGLDLARAGFRYSKDLPLEVPAYERQGKARGLLRRPKE